MDRGQREICAPFIDALKTSDQVIRRPELLRDPQWRERWESAIRKLDEPKFPRLRAKLSRIFVPRSVYLPMRDARAILLDCQRCDVSDSRELLRFVNEWGHPGVGGGGHWGLVEFDAVANVRDAFVELQSLVRKLEVLQKQQLSGDDVKWAGFCTAISPHLWDVHPDLLPAEDLTASTRVEAENHARRRREGDGGQPPASYRRTPGLRPVGRRLGLAVGEVAPYRLRLPAWSVAGAA